MVPELGVPAIFPSCGSVIPGSPFPPQGPTGRFPCFIGTFGCSDFLPPVPVRFSCPLRAGTAHLGRRRQDLPRFLGSPTAAVPRSSTPVARALLALAKDLVLPSG